MTEQQKLRPYIVTAIRRTVEEHILFASDSIAAQVELNPKKWIVTKAEEINLDFPKNAPCQRIDYDTDYYGGNYSYGSESNAYVPIELCENIGEEATFQAFTGYDQQHIVWIDPSCGTDDCTSGVYTMNGDDWFGQGIEWVLSDDVVGMFPKDQKNKVRLLVLENPTDSYLRVEIGTNKQESVATYQTGTKDRSLVNQLIDEMKFTLRDIDFEVGEN
ncbi:hypothetical protein ACQ4M3_09655 [Leptolyngbya sp. AN03gr2]|uniref:hypothetical protein n=1 Tax=Leptolyngbya sp. AN03gr2 TaxID=3423364 RepID=UPI003D321C21